LSGELFDSHGKPCAHWSARAVAIQQLEPLELFYSFQGTSHRKTLPTRHTGPVTGIGVFAFQGTDSGKPPRLGSGWFATGDTERAEFDPRNDVYLERLSREDNAILRKTRGGDSSAREHLIAKRFRELASRYNAANRMPQ